MVTTSADFKTAIKAPSRKIVGRMSFPNVAVNEKIIQSIEIENNLASEDFTIGIAAMSMASVELEEDLYEGLTVPGDLTGQTCNIEIGIQLPNGSMEYVSMGLFTVESFEREQTKIRMKLVDAMYKADKQYDKSKNVTTVGTPVIVQIMAPPVYPTTLYQIARHAALQCGLVLDTASWPNSDYVVTYEPVYEGISCRQILAQIAELAGGYALINREGNLEIKTLGNTVTRDLIDSDMFSYKEHQGNVGTVEKVIVKVGDEQAYIGDGVNIYTVVDNMFVQNPSNVVTALYNSLKDIYYYPVSNMEWSGDFSLDMADMVTTFGKATYILNRTIKVAGGLTETMNSPVKSNVERDSTGKNNTQLEINRVKTEIKVVSGEIDQKISDVNGNISNINQTIASISQSVQTKASVAEVTILSDKIESKVSQQDVNDLIAQINQANPNLITNLSENWEQGTINSTTGVLEDSSLVIRSKAFFTVRQGYVTFSVAPLYQALIVIYTNGYAFSQSAGFANQHTFLLPENSYFKMALRRVNSAAIVPDAINTAELKVENSQAPTKYQPYVGDLTLSQQQDYYILDVRSNNGWVVDEANYTATLTARIYLFNEDVTARFEPYQFTWLKRYPDGTLENLGNEKSKVITSASLERSATIACEFEILDTIYLLSTYNGDTLLTISNDTIMVIGDYQ